ncbi:hypothetical protein CSB09_04730 [Candidatus Gracilibacteria bacterium]|nr:MAG: hypothetical protein CSB09_04730 [Candidatus Gracilibacteria bacterium]
MEISEEKIFVRNQGITYTLNLKNNTFQRESRTHKYNRFLTQNELEWIYSTAVKQDPENTQKIGSLDMLKIRLEQVKNEYFKPKIKGDKSISVLIGEGENQLEYMINPSYSYKIHRKTDSDNTLRVMRGLHYSNSGYTQITKSEIEEILGKAIKNMKDGDEKGKILALYFSYLKTQKKLPKQSNHKFSSRTMRKKFTENGIIKDIF